MADKLRSVAEFSPVIVLSGARQAGKSTLLRNEAPFKDWHYVSYPQYIYCNSDSSEKWC